MSEALQQLLDTLSIWRRIDTNIYRGQTPETRNKRVFGGQVFAQAMRAAQDTVQKTAWCIPSTPIFCAPVIPQCLYSMRSMEFVTAAHLPPAGSLPPSAAKRFLIRSYHFRWRGRAVSSGDMPDCGGQKDLEMTTSAGQKDARSSRKTSAKPQQPPLFAPD